jgi:hypothetical protein
VIELHGLQGPALAVALLVVGWGFGLAGAVACRSVRPSGRPRGLQALVAGLVLALVVAASSSFAYARVLDVVGVIDYCDPVAAAAAFC